MTIISRCVVADTRWNAGPANRRKEETLSAAEKYRAVADHLQAMRNIRELPEGTWIYTALAEVQRLQEEESQL